MFPLVSIENNFVDFRVLEKKRWNVKYAKKHILQLNSFENIFFFLEHLGNTFESSVWEVQSCINMSQKLLSILKNQSYYITGKDLMTCAEMHNPLFFIALIIDWTKLEIMKLNSLFFLYKKLKSLAFIERDSCPLWWFSKLETSKVFKNSVVYGFIQVVKWPA